MLLQYVARQVPVLLCLIMPATSFRYILNMTLPSDKDRLTLSEGWMYGSGKGPSIAAQGVSFVETSLEVTAVPVDDKEPDFSITIMFYRTAIEDMREDNIDICSERSPPNAFQNVERHSFDAKRLTGNYGHTEKYRADVETRHAVNEGGLQNVFFQVCPANVKIKSLHFAGELSFHNPYGYLPGMDFGCLPFEICRVAASIILAAYFSSMMWRHRLTILPVHYMILSVVLLGTVEALSWLVAYNIMNTTGKPYCCPYPGSVIWAMIMEVLRRTTSRFLLLVICLGFGITRVSLDMRQTVAVLSLTAAFFVSGILQLASAVAAAKSIANVDDDGSFLGLPAVLTDMIFLTWIYGALANMIKELKEKNETYKLQMYRALAWTLAAFVTLFTTLAVGLLTAQGSEQSWQWKWEWTQVVAWEVLNFSMLTAVSIIWRPTERSAMLAYSMQLATTDSAAEDNDGIHGIQLGQSGDSEHFTIDDEDAQTYRVKSSAAAATLPETTSTVADGDYHDDDMHGEEPDDEDHKDQGKEGVVYSLSSFEPQRHTDLT